MATTFRQLICGLGLLMFLVAGTARSDDEQVVPASLEELQIAISGVLEQYKIPALGIVLADENGPVWVDGIGKANLRNSTGANADTLFRIGSTSKMFVALAVLKLVEEGKLSLDDRLSELAPEIGYENPWAETDPIRIVHLLEHTTGWDDLHMTEYAHNDPTPASLKQGLDFHPHSRISRWKPGSRYAYCNSGPPVAAYVVEKITGQEFEHYIIENFFEPMGMDSMTFLLSEDVRERGATLYSNGTKEEDYWHIIMRPAGSINASANDMLRFLQFYLNHGVVDGQALISEASLKRMETAVSTPGSQAGLQIGYALHNYASPHKQWVYREHNGGVNGGLTELAYLPEYKRGHVIMINADNGAAFRKISKLVRDFETHDLATSEFRPDRAVNERTLQIEGHYYPINPRQDMARFLDPIFSIRTLSFEDQRLSSKGLFDDEVTYFLPAGEGVYRSEKTGLISLVEAEDPLAGNVVHAGSTVLKRISALRVYLSLGLAFLWAVLMVTSLLFFLVWIVRRIRGRIPAGGAIRVRLWPLLASVSVAGFVLLFVIGFSDPFGLLGRPTPVSVGIMLLTIAFAVFSVLGVYTSIRERHTRMNRVAYIHSTISSFTHLIVTVYLLWFGVIGIMVWA